ncbi:substrate-binding domain-containing protein [Rhodococcus sp. BP-252]|uniref:substrate-binding domain-containing protein n=1 Tax=unclassified Rhodococcus (in: high G+C Gram-positive bacteria) TaxID=192944 RepID=UPI0014029898|nr:MULTISPECIES: substrate-binding domain-containing protein [unclassified Rhodococcus (in: high G+C Gram-positive bacteria)]MBY6411577.1 substrate-binding domain-containing protein [Rhodococcus sp. BP-320]MBY6417959.1 substrate-binding domain-containing protein [Rhodococcus sp. BP-321]MBY6422140.1 substrate-binding domain-containing protein [Rhodococcus sp. BP-324]MBY6427757.1 substrate-binding domain-containing protein [Rhodococcus sp. BP-323]MBY6433024.1 substrate-binding domain-containing 
MFTGTRTRAFVAVVSACLLASACSSSSADEGTGQAADVAGAQAVADRYEAAPTDLVLDTPLSRAPDSGKYVISIETPQPISSAKNDAIQQAADVLGWRYQRILMGTDAEAAPKAVDQAIALRPDAIHVSGTPLTMLSKQIESARAAGIPVIADSIAGPPVPGVISTALDGDAQVQEWGKMVASQVIADSDGDANVAIFSITDYSILNVFTDAFTAQLKEQCPDCKVQLVNQQVTDLGTKTPQSVVSTLQRDPTINYALFSFGDLVLGVDAALRGASLQDQVTFAGQTPTPDNLQSLKDGDNSVWVGFPVQILGWRVLDTLARQFNGDDIAVADAAFLPTQLLNADNIDSAVLDEATGYYAGVADYQQQFETLWQK